MNELSEGISAKIDHVKGWLKQKVGGESRVHRGVSSEQVILGVVERSPKVDAERLRTYGNALIQVPEEVLAGNPRIVEVGMNGQLFKFRQLFGKETRFFGITIDSGHAKSAMDLARKQRLKAEVLMRDIRDGLPDNWMGMDIGLDVYSASHYVGTKVTIDGLAPAIEPGGYLVLVPGDDIEGAANYVRTHPDSSNNPVYFRHERGGMTDIYDDGTNEEFAERIATRLREAGFSEIPERPSVEVVSQCLDEVSHIVSEEVVTDYDLSLVGKYKAMEHAGFEQIRKFNTPDGLGLVGKKKE